MSELSIKKELLDPKMDDPQKRLELLEDILDNLPATVYVKDRGGHHIFANKRDLKIKHVKTREEIIGKTDLDFFKPDLAKELMEDERRIIDSGNPLMDKEEVFPDESGKEQWLLTSKLPLKDRNGEVIGIIGVGQDINKFKEDQDTLNALTIKLFEPESTENILRQIIKNAMDISNTESGIIYLVTKDSTGVYCLKDSYKYPEDSHNPEPRLASGTGITHDVFVSGEPVWIPNTKDDERANPDLWDLGTKAFLAVPLKQGKKIIGVFYVNDSEPREFLSSEIKHLSTLATYAVIALEKAGLIEEKDEAQHQIAELHAASSAFIASDDPDSILEALSKNALSVTGADWVNIVLLDESTVKGIVNCPLDPTFTVDKIRQRPTGNSFRIFDTGHSMIFTGAKKNLAKLNPFTFHSEYKSVIGIPLKAEKNRSIGVLWLHFLDEQNFSIPQVNALEIFAQQGAIAYNNALRQKKIKLTQRISKEVTAEILKGDKQKTLSLIINSIKSVIDCSSIVLFVYDSTRNELEHPPTTIGLKEPGATAVAGRVLPDSIVYEMLSEKSYCIVEDVTKDKRFRDKPFTRRENNQSVIVVPLAAFNKSVGVMFINYQQKHIFTSTELEIIKTFADYAAMAIPIAQLLGETQEHAKVFESLSSISSDISTVTNIDSILQKIAQKTRDFFEAEDCDIYLFNETHEVINEYHTNEKNPYPKPRLKNVNSISAHVIRTKKVDLIDDVNTVTDIDFNPQLIKLNISSMMVAPLCNKAEVIGIIYVYFKNLKKFIDNDSSILNNLANDAAIAISNENRHLNEIEALHKIAQMIVVQNEQSPVLTGILQSVKSLMPDLVRTDIWLPNKHTKKWSIEYSLGDIDAKKLINKQLDIGQGIIGKATKFKKVTYVTNVNLEPDYIRYSQKTNSELVIPMVDGDEVIGVLNIERPNVDDFFNLDIQLAIAIADLAVVALKNNTQFTRIKHNQQIQIEAIGKMAESISASAKGIHEILQSIFGLIATLMVSNEKPPCLIEILQINPDDHKLKQFNGWLGDGSIKKNFPPKNSPGIFSKVIDEKHYQIIHDNSYETLARTRHVKSVSQMVIPMIQDGGLFGILNIEHTDANVLNEFEDLVNPLANLVLIAIDHVNKYEEIKQAKKKIGGRTALAWMNLASGTWYHDVRGEAATIQNVVKNMEDDFNQHQNEKIQEHFGNIRKSLRAILDKKELLPYDLATDVTPINIYDTLESQFTIIMIEKINCGVVFSTPKIDVDKFIEVFANTDWLKNALDILVTNGINATETCEKRVLSLSAYRRKDFVVIKICDTGVGMPEEIVAALAEEVPTINQLSSKGLGMGLLLVQAIVDSFGGNLKVAKTDKSGTTMEIALPICFR